MQASLCGYPIVPEVAQMTNTDQQDCRSIGEKTLVIDLPVCSDMVARFFLASRSRSVEEPDVVSLPTAY